MFLRERERSNARTNLCLYVYLHLHLMYTPFKHAALIRAPPRNLVKTAGVGGGRCLNSVCVCVRSQVAVATMHNVEMSETTSDNMATTCV